MVTAIAASRASAAPVIYTNEADFQAAVAAAGIITATESFEGLTPGIKGDLDLGALAVPSLFLNFVSDDPVDATDGTNSLVVLPPTFLPTFSFANPIRAFSLDVIGALDTGEDNDLFVDLDDQSHVLFSGQFPAGHVQFFGVLDTIAPFTNVTVFSTGFPDLFTIDRVRYEDTTAVPEPASLTLLGLGLLVAVRRRRV